MPNTDPSSSVLHAWPQAQPYDVLFYRWPGAKAAVNIFSQHVYDPTTIRVGRRFTHCALVGSELTALEVYPRAVRGTFTGVEHPAGVRFVALADMCANASRRYRDFAVLRAPEPLSDITAAAAEAMGMGAALLEHRYGLRRFFGMPHLRFPGEAQAVPGTEWLSCADIVHKVLFASGKFGLAKRDTLGPMTLFADLRALGWRDVSTHYAEERFEHKQRRCAEKLPRGAAALDVFALHMAWFAGTMDAAARVTQYALESRINATVAHDGPAKSIDEAIAALETLRAQVRPDAARSAERLMAGLRSYRGLLK